MSKNSFYLQAAAVEGIKIRSSFYGAVEGDECVAPPYNADFFGAVE